MERGLVTAGTRSVVGGPFSEVKRATLWFSWKRRFQERGDGQQHIEALRRTLRGTGHFKKHPIKKAKQSSKTKTSWLGNIFTFPGSFNTLKMGPQDLSKPLRQRRRRAKISSATLAQGAAPERGSTRYRGGTHDWILSYQTPTDDNTDHIEQSA